MLILCSAVREINRINQRELELGVADKGSWHDEYKGAPFSWLECSQMLTTHYRLGICVHRWFAVRSHRRRCHHCLLTVCKPCCCFEDEADGSGRFGEVMDINMPRDKETGKVRGFGFLMYEDQRSTVLAVDNMNGSLILGRTIRVSGVPLVGASKLTRYTGGSLSEVQAERIKE